MARWSKADIVFPARPAEPPPAEVVIESAGIADVPVCVLEPARLQESADGDVCYPGSALDDRRSEVAVPPEEPPVTRSRKPRTPSAKDWPPERVERAFSLYRQQLTASQIAAVLGGVTRNAVIGLINRKKWHLTDKPEKPGPRPQRRSTRAERLKALDAAIAGKRALPKPMGGGTESVALSPRPPREPMPAEPAVTSEGIGFFDLKDRHCRFPLWPHAAKPVAAEQLYCGAPVRAEGESWCAACAARVMTPYAMARQAPRPSQLRR